MGEPSTRRLAPEERKALLVAAAEETFATRGYTQAGLAEVAVLAGVSKTLLYHYFPDGRPELYREVMERLVGEVVEAVQVAVRAPTTIERRLDALVTTLLGYFEERPDAYRLLILEPWGSGDPGVVAQAIAVRARLAGRAERAPGLGRPTAAGDHGGQRRRPRRAVPRLRAAHGRPAGPRNEAAAAALAFVHAGLDALELV